ncbi:hypothetical protein BH09ACT1_BH09ACT1_22790 [soil metagenome]
MNTQSETSEALGRRSGSSAFRRVGVTVAVACAVTGSIAGLGVMGALAAPSSSPAAHSAKAAASTSAPKITYTDADLAAFAASPYADDALNLAVVWGVDTDTARGKAGSKILAGAALPFAADEAETVNYTDDQKTEAYYATTAEDTVTSDFTRTLGLAVAWGSPKVTAAKARVGGFLLAHQAVPAAPASFTADQEALAFTLVGYGDDEAAKLAGLWQTDTRSAMVKAGTALLAGHDLPL